MLEVASHLRSPYLMGDLSVTKLVHDSFKNRRARTDSLAKKKMSRTEFLLRSANVTTDNKVKTKPKREIGFVRNII